ncbi:hypothetical protein L249_2473 [Ophiocordyceps polyrhachis-furcata BCC 54312]|uniref:Uncharacterized protein n=1 Tax=Ophiocordyceps polyrhachis-furcata BCC 54312 TaxID=1330021 RepID=A0A367LPT8_9HYPO|nr:hypothetical protein L249_2473 [Ophiocordyceps polyrhachis-furcata BCC 54312]
MMTPYPYPSSSSSSSSPSPPSISFLLSHFLSSITFNPFFPIQTSTTLQPPPPTQTIQPPKAHTAYQPSFYIFTFFSSHVFFFVFEKAVAKTTFNLPPIPSDPTAFFFSPFFLLLLFQFHFPSLLHTRLNRTQYNKKKTSSKSRETRQAKRSNNEHNQPKRKENEKQDNETKPHDECPPYSLVSKPSASLYSKPPAPVGLFLSYHVASPHMYGSLASKVQSRSVVASYTSPSPSSPMIHRVQFPFDRRRREKKFPSKDAGNAAFRKSWEKALPLFISPHQVSIPRLGSLALVLLPQGPTSPARFAGCRSRHRASVGMYIHAWVPTYLCTYIRM